MSSKISVSLEDTLHIKHLIRCRVSAHCLILKASSKYFATLLERKYVKGAQNKITVNGIDGHTLKAIVNYCYKGRVEVNELNEDIAFKIIAAASRMGLCDVKQSVNQYWNYKLSEENCLAILAKADTYSLEKLREKALTFCAMEFDHLPISEKLNFDGKTLADLLKWEKFRVSEEEIFTFVVTWVEHKEKYRSKLVPHILELIRLKHMTSEVSCRKYSHTKENLCTETFPCGLHYGFTFKCESNH